MLVSGELSGLLQIGRCNTTARRERALWMLCSGVVCCVMVWYRMLCSAVRSDERLLWSWMDKRQDDDLGIGPTNVSAAGSVPLLGVRVRSLLP